MSLLRSFSVAVMLAWALPVAAAEPQPSPAVAKAAATPSPADLALREQERSLVRQAGESVDRNDRPHAVALLEQARRLRPDPSLDYNLGVTYAEMKQDPDAAHAFGRFLRTADPARVLPERIAEVRKRAAVYEKSLSRLRLRISVPPGGLPGATVLFLDDRPASIPLTDGALPKEIDPLWLKPGLHTLRVTSPGLREYQVSVELAPGELRQASGDLYPDQTASAGLLHDLPKPDENAPRPLYKKWWFWTAIGAGTVAAISLIAAGAAGSFNHKAPGSDLDSVDLALTSAAAGRR